MATSPIYVDNACHAAGLIGTAETSSFSAPTNTTTMTFTGAATINYPLKIQEITLQGIATSVAGLVIGYIYDGTTYHAFDQWLVNAATVTVSAGTVLGWRVSRPYSNLWLLSSSYSLRFAQNNSSNASVVKASVFALSA